MLPNESELKKIQALEHHDPFSILGRHPMDNERFAIRAFLPWAREAVVLNLHDKSMVYPMSRTAGDLFQTEIKGDIFDYKIRAVGNAGDISEFYDPYSFPPVTSEKDLYLWNEGSCRRAYRFMGAHPRKHNDVNGVCFAVWAPNAVRVSVVGDWNGWDGRIHAMRVRGASGVWEIFIPEVNKGAHYKYEIKTRQGDVLLKADPFSFYNSIPPGTASIVWGIPQDNWNDGQWMEKRRTADILRSPQTTYEVHMGSWRRRAGEGGRSLSYDELSKELVDYVADLGFTHLQLLPIMEHPFEGSWGYQVTGYFAATSRWGKPEELQGFINACHEKNIGVYLDWVPAHFPNDAHGLAWFDGTALFEHEDPRLGFHQDWGTLIFNYGRKEVQSFLISSALYWLDVFHADGLRVDAVASMLYLNYSRNAGEWIPNREGGCENLDAVDFLRHMNVVLHEEFPGATTIAEESTAWPGVSRPVHLGGLGFGLKWNMGWMHDTLRYFSKEPIYRKYHHDDITFPLLYAFHENFVLPLSHDEVVHMKGSLLDKMPGDAWQKFANLRLLYAYMWAEPGKKLLFMGSEFAQGTEWRHDGSLPWDLLGVSWHEGIHRFMRDLLHLYKETPALWKRDFDPKGFEWVDFRDVESGVVSFIRWGDQNDKPIFAAFNTTPVVRKGYRLGVPKGGQWKEALNSDADVYGGGNVGNMGSLFANPVPCHGQPFSFEMTLPPLGALFLTPEE